MAKHRHTHTHTQAGEKKRLARCLPVCLPFVDIFNHTQNVKEQQFTLNDTRRRAVDAAACPRVMQLANSNSGAGIQATRQSGSQAVRQSPCWTRTRVVFAFVAATLALSAINKFPVKWALVWQVEHNGTPNGGRPTSAASAALKPSSPCRTGSGSV